MKHTFHFTLAGALLMVLFITINACKDDDFPVPIASTQADFTYVSELIEDAAAPLGKKFKVTFTNKSLNAKSYFWDFGNGETSSEKDPVTYYLQSGQFNVVLRVTSDHQLHYNKLEKSVSLTFILDALSLPFFENFDSQESIPDFFTILDEDGDGLTWYWGIRQGNGTARSQSYNSATGAALTPNNYLITPKLDLTQVAAGKSVKLSWKICPSANTPIYRQEHYGVFVSTTGKVAANFTHNMFEETLTTDMTNWVGVLRTVDLSQFIGQYIYIAFRHFNVTDKDRIILDDIHVYIE